jgi:hypothetical protein
MESQFTASMAQDSQLMCCWILVTGSRKPVASLDLGAEALPRSELSSELLIRK